MQEEEENKEEENNVFILSKNKCMFVRTYVRTCFLAVFSKFRKGLENAEGRERGLGLGLVYFRALYVQKGQDTKS